MASESLEVLVGKVQQRVGPLPDYYLVVDALVSGAREIFRDRDWTFRRRRSQFIFNAAYSTGTCAIVRGTDYADFSGATLTQSMVGRQLRAGGNQTQIVTIKQVAGSRAYFDQEWGGASLAAGTTFEIYNAYMSAPPDFTAFISIVDLTRSMQLNWWSLTAADLDRVDPARSYGGGDQAYAVVLRDYTDDGIGAVGTLIQVRGSGNVPASSGSYAGIEDGVFTIEMTAAAVYKWKKGSGAYVTGVAVDAGSAQELQDGVTVTFTAGVTYTSGDVFVVPVTAAHAAGRPRYEPWPHIKADETRPYLYLARPLDLSEVGAVLPAQIPSDLVVEKALAAIARWKHPENGYYDLRLAQVHEDRASYLLIDVIREDEAKESTMLAYDNWVNWPTYDSEYLAGHDLGFEYDIL